MATDAPTTEFHLAERGFEGSLRIEDHDGARHVLLSGVCTDGSEAAVEKEVPADRDERLAQLVDAASAGDREAAVAVLAHLGVLDPE